MREGYLERERRSNGEGSNMNHQVLGGEQKIPAYAHSSF
jgi:hypothetical protein